jgi:hypothetical protein
MTREHVKHYNISELNELKEIDCQKRVIWMDEAL